MKSIGFTAFALVLTAATGAQAQTVISRQVKSEPVETVVTRQANGTVTTSRRPVQMAALQPANRAAGTTSRIAMAHKVVRGEPRAVRAPVQKQIVYRTIVQREVVQAPQPQMMIVREPRTTWMPSLLPPFSYPVTTYEDRVVYTTPSYASPSYQTVRVVADEDDDAPVVRAYAPATYVVAPPAPQTVRVIETPRTVLRVPAPSYTYATISEPDVRILASNLY